MNKGLEQLRLLSIGYYVAAGLTALFSCIPFIHLAIGIAIVSGKLDGEAKPPPPELGWIFVAGASVFILIGWSLAIGSFLAGRFIARQKNYTFIFVMAIINCMFAPVGTIVGVFTFIVLLRDSVKALFDGKSFAPPAGNQAPDWK